jgi:hypothetical protein
MILFGRFVALACRESVGQWLTLRHPRRLLKLE